MMPCAFNCIDKFVELQPIFLMKAAIFQILSLIAISVFISGCESARPFRTNYQTGVNPNPTNSNYVVEQTKDYTLGFVEFDDQGWLWNQQQIDAVADKFSAEMQTQGLLIVTFVHGWKHNADSQDGNVQMMRLVLGEIAVLEQNLSEQEKRPARRVAGVYIGWRGLSENVEPLEELSFWGRKNAAETVGHGAVVQLLTALENLKKQGNTKYSGEIAGHQRMSTKLIIIGHSLAATSCIRPLRRCLRNEWWKMLTRMETHNFPKVWATWSC
jgi:hypothetical protein